MENKLLAESLQDLWFIFILIIGSKTSSYHVQSDLPQAILKSGFHATNIVSFNFQHLYAVPLMYTSIPVIGTHVQRTESDPVMLS